MKYVTGDSGRREKYATGMQRDVSDDKPRFDLIVAEGIPYEAQMLTRLAGLYQRGAIKYQARNHEKARTEKELDRFKESAFRHFLQWYCGENDEDHACAIIWNVTSYEHTVWRITNENMPRFLIV